MTVLILSFIFLLLLNTQAMDAQAVGPVEQAGQTIRLEVLDDTYAKEQIWYGRPFLSRYLYLGWDPYTAHKRTRPHFKYNLGDPAMDGVTSGQIESATLNLYNWRPINPDPFDVKIYPITQDWNYERLEWNNQPAVGDTSLVRTFKQRPDWEVLDITPIIKAQLKGEIPNYGLAIHKILEYEDGTWLCSNNGTYPLHIDKCDVDTLPFVEITLKGVRTINPPTPKVEIRDGIVYLSWESGPEGTPTYQVEYSQTQGFQAAILVDSTANQSEFHNLPREQDLYFRVRALEEETISDWSQILAVTIPPEPQAPAPKPKPKPPVAATPTPPKAITQLTSPAEPPREEVAPEVEIDTEQVLGITDVAGEAKDVTTSDCHFQYNVEQKVVKIIKCTLPTPQIYIDRHIKAEDQLYWISINVDHQDTIKVQIDVTDCKSPTWYDPRTWFWCITQQQGSETHTQQLEYTYLAKANTKTFKSYPSNNDGQIMIQSEQDLGGRELKVFASASFSRKLENGYWLDFHHPVDLSEGATVPGAISSETLDGKPFRLPFDKSPGVTQWHGYTAFQSPHTGIDFGVTKEKIYAIADGVVQAALWDSYYGPCRSGGNVLRIKQVNGMHSVYMHLTNYNRANGTPLKVGDSIKSGEQIGLTGNSGAWNCQPLGHHLHMEVRKGRPQSTHVDPVPFISTNWDRIPTLGATSYPGRLTGDNPHPGR